MRELARARSSADSIRIMYDIFDCSPRARQSAWAKRLLSTAACAHDYAAQHDMIRQLAVMNGKDTRLMDSLIRQAEKLPASIGRRITVIFVKSQKLAAESGAMPDAKRHRRVARMITAFANDRSGDILSRFERIYAVCIVLGQGSKGMLYLQAMDTMGKLVEQLPQQAYPIRNQYYTALANIYTNTENYAAALKADRKLLQIISQLEEHYHSCGRHLRNYAPMRFISYRRMLENYRGLGPGEAERIYARVQDLSAADHDVADTESSYPAAHMYYLMATGRYAEAIPLIRKILSRPGLKINQRRRALRELRVAADATGDKSLQLLALRQYTAITDQFDSIRLVDNLTELGIRCNLLDMQRENHRLMHAARQEAAARARLIYLCLAAVIAALAFAVIRLHLSRRRLRTYNKRHMMREHHP